METFIETVDAGEDDSGAPSADMGREEGELVVRAEPGLDLAGETVAAHWSKAGGELGEQIALGAWPAGAAELVVALLGVSSVPAQRLDLEAAGVGGGTLSIA